MIKGLSFHVTLAIQFTCLNDIYSCITFLSILVLESDVCMILMCVCFNYSQLFALYETLPDPSVKNMEGVVDTGINVVALVYFLVSSGGLSGEQGARKVSFTAFPLGKKDKHIYYTCIFQKRF